MKLGIIQPNYIPWRGYFDFIAQCDYFLFLTDVQYTKRDWRNRNLIRTGPNAVNWLTVPTWNDSRGTPINSVQISYREPWQQSHLNRFAEHYHLAPFYQEARQILENSFEPGFERLASLTVDLTCHICRYLGITTRMGASTCLHSEGAKSEKLVNLCRMLGADTYLSGPRAKDYLDIDLFSRYNIRVEWMDYQGYPEYHQQYPGFDGAVTVLDVIANTGPQAAYYTWKWRQND